jgi:hypothetical protein
VEIKHAWFLKIDQDDIMWDKLLELDLFITKGGFKKDATLLKYLKNIKW